MPSADLLASVDMQRFGTATYQVKGLIVDIECRDRFIAEIELKGPLRCHR